MALAGPQAASPLRRVTEKLIWTTDRIVPKNSSLIVLYGLTESEDGALAIEQALRDRGRELTRLTDSTDSPYRSPAVRYRRKKSLRGMWAFLRAGSVISSHELFGGRATVSGQRMVLFWHGEATKPVGLLDGDRPVATDFAPVCSVEGQTFRAAEFGLSPSQVPILGAPRNDRMLATVHDDARRRLGWGEDEHVWLWLPTYRTAIRGGRRTDSPAPPNGLPFDDHALHRLDEKLSETGITLVIKPHPLSEQEIPDDFECLHVMRQADIEKSAASLYQLLAVADGLITDVSSVWLDYLLISKPIIFAFPDIAEYRSRRGLNLEPYEELVPGPFVSDIDSLSRRLKEFQEGHDDFAGRRDEMTTRFHRYTDAYSAARLLDFLDL